MSKLVPVLCLAALLSSCGCSQKAEKEVPVPSDFPRMADGLSVPDTRLGHPVGFSILLPPSYVSEPDRRYPVVYMLHGYGDRPDSWNDQWLRVQAKVEEWEAKGLGEMIYVFPQGYKGYYCNRYDGSWPYMDMFVEDFIPYIDKTYRTLADRQHRAVTGYSMGGFGACALALKHPDLFVASAPLSMSFRTDAQYLAEPQEGWDSQWGSIFGGKGRSGEGRLTDYYKAHCPFYQFVPENKAAVSQVHWFFTCGDDEEQLLIAGDDLHVQMRDVGIAHEYRVDDGAHTGDYWRKALNEVLPMFDHDMNGGTLWTAHGKPDMAPATVARSGDGTFASPSYAKGSGTAVYLAYAGLSETAVSSLMAALDKSDLQKAFVILPCDLEKRTLAEWVGAWSAAYPAERQVCVTVGADGAQALAFGETFGWKVFIDAAVGTAPAVRAGEKVYLACTDEAVHYRDMGALYQACKASGADFEYRVLPTVGDGTIDAVRSIESLIAKIIY